VVLGKSGHLVEGGSDESEDQDVIENDGERSEGDEGVVDVGKIR